MSEDTIRLVRSGHEPLEIGISQVTTTTLARIFSLDPNTIWLREEFGQRAFFPDATSSQFEFPASIGASYGVVVEGSPQNRGTPSTSVPFAMPGPSGLGTPYRPLVPVSRKGPNTINVKITQAAMKHLPNGKVDFTSIGQAFIDVTDTTANVHYITDVVKKKWGTEYVLVTTDGLKLEDSSGTQGFKFWKVGSRKIYAVKCGDLKMKGRKHGAIVISDSDSDSDNDLLPLRKKAFTAPSSSLTPLMEEVKGIRKDIQCLFQLSDKNKISPSLYQALRDTFQCHICKSTPISPPVIFARCCHRILGCQACVDTWYRADDDVNRSCPMCRFERAYSETTTLYGLDDFLETITPILANPDETASTDTD